jgi:thioredoxin-like negative regulator of GroEL
MAAAEAIYLADPGGEGARRAFLENLALDEASLGRLRAAGAEARVELPVLGSLAELASEGNGEAALRLVEVAPVASREAAGAARYAQLLGEVAVDAGEPLLAALRQAPAPATDAAITALARAIAAQEEATAHPFPALLARAAAGDGEAGAFARDVATRLAERARTERAVRHTPPADAIGPSKQPPPGAKP